MIPAQVPTGQLSTDLGWCCCVGTGIDYLKIDCEGCEFDVITLWLAHELATHGVVRATQIQIEVHGGGPGSAAKTRRYAEAARSGRRPHLSTIMRPSTNERVIGLLAALWDAGFRPFHMDLSRHPHLCCGIEYSLYNVHAAKRKALGV